MSEIICREAAQRGVLPFVRFMELALYCPVHGYYETKKDNIGRHGDFYTSVGVGELFGQLLACQFAEWLEDQVQSPKSKVQIVEAGAHNGQLAKDILGWLQLKRSQLFQQIEYWIIEPSLRRQEWQKEILKKYAPRVRWVLRFNDSTIQRFNGVIFSNELLDAMPVRRFGWDAAKKAWFEWGVALDGEQFVWARCPDTLAPQSGEKGVDPPSILHLPPSLLEELPDGYTIETCPAAENWWREAANVLEHGKLLSIDYGLTTDELFSPSRLHGTVRAYFRHHASDDLLANAGEQDLTAHVNFSAIQKIGEACGLATEAFLTQSQFLTRIAEKIFKNPKSFGEWGAKQTRQFQTLTHPEHLGRAFRTLVQRR